MGMYTMAGIRRATGSGHSWTRAYEIDFTSQSAHDFTSTSTLSIGGATWTLTNGSVADQAEIVASTGYQDDPQTNTKWFEVTTCPYLHVTLDSCVDSLADTDILRIMWRQTGFSPTTAASQWLYAGGGIFNTSTIGYSVRAHDLSAQGTRSAEVLTRFNAGNPSAELVTHASGVQVFEMVLFGASCEVYRYTTQAAWPALRSGTALGAAGGFPIVASGPSSTHHMQHTESSFAFYNAAIGKAGAQRTVTHFAIDRLQTTA